MKADLDAAVAHAMEAAVHLAEWHARQTDVAAGRSYVAAGHDCITSIDDALRNLHTARTALISEIRVDEIERNIRVDEMLAQLRAERAARGGEDR